MGYVQEMRKKVGSTPIMVSASMCILYDEEKGILMQRRSDTGNWGIPGGGLEIGESEIDGLYREVKEETNLDIFNPKLFYVRSNVHMVYPNGDETYYTDIVFYVNEYSGELKLDEESLELKWFKLNELPDDIMPNQKLYIFKFKNDVENNKLITIKLEK